MTTIAASPYSAKLERKSPLTPSMSATPGSFGSYSVTVISHVACGKDSPSAS